MKVSISRITDKPIELIYKSYRLCYSKYAPQEIKIPMRETSMGDFPDIDAMSDFIKPLMSNGHTSPLEHVSITFDITGVSRALLAEITRHRTGKFNVQSQRYINANNFEFVTPQTIIDSGHIQQYNEFLDSSLTLYNKLLDSGVPKEDARFVLPNATSCNLTVTFDLNNFRKFLGLRLCVNAQWEIRQLAKEMLNLVEEYIPFAGYLVMNCGKICDECLTREEF